MFYDVIGKPCNVIFTRRALNELQMHSAFPMQLAFRSMYINIPLSNTDLFLFKTLLVVHITYIRVQEIYLTSACSLSFAFALLDLVPFPVEELEICDISRYFLYIALCDISRYFLYIALYRDIFLVISRYKRTWIYGDRRKNRRRYEKSFSRCNHACTYIRIQLRCCVHTLSAPLKFSPPCKYLNV